MKIPITANQFAARLSEEDLIFANEILSDLFPNRDLTDDSLTGRQIFMAIVEAASLKLLKKNASNPADLKMIEDLTASSNILSEENDKFINVLNIKSARIQEHENEITRLQTVIDGLNNDVSILSNDCHQIKESKEKLEKYVPVVNEMRIVLEPITSKLLALYAEKIRNRNKVETTPGEILTSLFVRYITKKETELPGFPFLVSKPEIVAIASELENE